MKKRNGHDTAQHAFDLITSEIERAQKLEIELRKLKEKLAEMELANASALGFISKHHGNSNEGFAVRKLLLATIGRAA